MKVTFFAESVVGYIGNPTAIYTRGLAHGLSLRGNEIRIVEERQNAAFVRTLQTAGSEAARHFHDSFRMFQHHTYEPRHGAQLLEWVTRELSLIDVAVAVAGIEPELCRWLANVTREGLVRAYLTFEPERLTDEVAVALELDRFDLILAPRQPAASIDWREIVSGVAGQDRVPVILGSMSPPPDEEVDPIRAAEVFEAAFSRSASESSMLSR
ncbi:MAG TPA: hypothetical protein VEX37_06425 [Thermomicrobiales bacterium]|nr:hypothetical protein [Thermomicrobiales bacterium]